MFEFLRYAIEARDENIIILLLKVIPEVYFSSDEGFRIHLFSLLKQFECKRSLDYLKSTRPAYKNTPVNKVVTKNEFVPVEEVDLASLFWNEICSLSQSKATIESFKYCVEKYIAIGLTESKASLHDYMKMSNIQLLLGDYHFASMLIRDAVSQLCDPAVNNHEISALSIVNAAISDLLLITLRSFSIKLPDNFITLFKNNLYYIQHGLDIGHEALLFPLEGGSFDRDSFALLKDLTKEFSDFHRGLRQVNLRPLNDKDAPFVQKTIFIFKRFSDWFSSIEKKNNFTINYQTTKELIEEIKKFKFDRLLLLKDFFGTKKVFLNMLEQLLARLNAKSAFMAEYHKAVEIEQVVIGRLNYFQQEKFLKEIGEESTTKAKKQPANNKKKKKDNKDFGNKASDDAAAVLSTKSLEDYVELPTYYPEPTKNNIMSDDTIFHLTKLKTKEAHHACLFSQSKRAHPEPRQFKLLDVLESRSSKYPPAFYCKENRLEFINLDDKDDFFNQYPEFYLDAVYWSNYLNAPFSPAILSAIRHIKPALSDLLYQANINELRHDYQLFTSTFGQTETIRIFIKSGILKFFLDTGIIDLNKTVASPTNRR